MIYQNRFAFADRVTWRNDEYATMTDGRKKYGDGPFTVMEVKDIPTSVGEDSEEFDTFDDNPQLAVGHVQQIRLKQIEDIDNIKDKDNAGQARWYSGAFFVKVESKTLFDEFTDEEIANLNDDSLALVGTLK